MLSVRSLKKIAQRKGLVPATAPTFVHVESAPGGGGGGVAEPKSGTQTRTGKRARIVVAGDKPADSTAAEEDDSTTAEALRCPTTEELMAGVSSWCAATKELVVEAWQAGAGNVLLGIVLLWAFGLFMRMMVDYLQSELDMELPEVHVTDAVFGFMEMHPVLALSLNYFGAALIGLGFFYLETLIELRNKVGFCLRFGRCPGSYQELEDEELAAEATRPPTRCAAASAGDIETGEAGGSMHGGRGGAGAEDAGLSADKLAKLSAEMRLQVPTDVAYNIKTPLTTARSGSETARSGISGKGTARLSLPEVLTELRRVTDRAEELEIRTRVLFKKASTPGAAEAKAELRLLQQRRDELLARYQRMSQMSASASSKPARDPGGLTKLCQTALVQIIARSTNGIFSVGVYFADLVSDVQVIVLLLNTRNYLWAAEGAFLLVLQFFIVHLRVLPYLRSTFGSSSMLYLTFLFLGFPLGLLALDVAMFFEPFGLLAVLPFPDWLRQFVPAYKATRIIAEVVIESLPQCFLQSYIYIVVLANAKAGTATESELAMMQFTAVLPTSIFISTIAMLKMWIEVVHGARQAGLTIHAKAIQLWEVGAGLPLDALKKGAIVEWSCPYVLEGPEISPLLDALGRNSSLVFLDLAKSGLTWTSAKATGRPLLENMANNKSALSGTRTLIISAASRYKIPLLKLRKGGEEAVAALRSTPLFSSGGPRKEELLFIGDLLRKGTDLAPASQTTPSLQEEAARERVVAMRSAAKGGKLKRDAWELQLCSLLVEGHLRRGHLLNAISSEALREVGFTAAELLANGVTLASLREGGFTADGLRAAGLKAAELAAAGFTASELKGGGFSAKELRAVGFSPLDLKNGGFLARQLREVGVSAEEMQQNFWTAVELREGSYALAELKRLFSPLELRVAGFSAKEMRDASFPLTALKEGGFPPEELRGGAGYYCSEMKAAGFSIEKMKVAGFSGAEMRIAGFSAAAMKEAAFSAKKLRAAGFTASECLEAGWSVEVLRAAGYDASELREARRGAAELRSVGFSLRELREGGYATAELQAIGYNPEELRAAGVKLSELAMAGATVADLKAAGISAIGLKAENMALADLKAAGYKLIELKQAGYTPAELRSVGFDAAALMQVGCSTHELRVSGYSANELSAAGCTVRDLKEAGFSSVVLKKSGFSAEQLLAGGFVTRELKDGGFSASELRAADVGAADLRVAGFLARALRTAGFACAELRSAGFTCEELYANGEGGYTPAELKEVGFSAKVLTSVGLSLQALVSVAFMADDLAEAGYKIVDLRKHYSVSEVHKLGFALKDMKAGGYKAGELRKAGFSAKDLKEIGFSFDDLRKGGCTTSELMAEKATIKELRAIGCTVPELRQNGVSVKDMKSAGFGAGELRSARVPAKELEMAGFTAHALKEGGYAVMEIKECGMQASSVFSIAELRTGGYPLEALIGEGFELKDLKEYFSIDELRTSGGYRLQDFLEVGFSATDLKTAAHGFVAYDFYVLDTPVELLRDARFTSAELRTGGYAAQELIRVGFGPADLRAGGYTAAQCRAAGLPASAVKAGGFGAGEMSSGGYEVAELRDAGFPVKTLRLQANLPVKALKDVGFPVAALRAGGCTAEELAESGCGAQELYKGGFRVKQLREVGFSAMQLREAGLSIRELREAGRFNASELYAIGVMATELREGGYPLKQLKEQVGLSAEDLRVAGFSAEALEDVGFTAKQLRQCGFPTEEMARCGFSAEALRAAGFTAVELKDHLGMTAKELRDGGYTMAEVKAAKFEPWQYKALGT